MHSPRPGQGRPGTSLQPTRDHTLSTSDKLNALADTFADPFPSEYASRDQIDALRVDVQNARLAVVTAIRDEFANLMEYLESRRPASDDRQPE